MVQVRPGKKSIRIRAENRVVAGAAAAASAVQCSAGVEWSKEFDWRAGVVS